MASIRAAWRSTKIYLLGLSNDDQIRYREKLQRYLGSRDPYSTDFKDLTSEVASWPPVDIHAIIDYLVYAVSPETGQQRRNFKSIEASNFFTSGFVLTIMTLNEDVQCSLPSDQKLFIGVVRRSQSTSQPPACPWIVLDTSGKAISGHCTCLAGTDGACSHVGAVLYYIKHEAQKSNQTEQPVLRSCTEGPNMWLPPKNPYAEMKPIEQVNFDSPAVRFRKSQGTFREKKTKKPKTCSTEKNISHATEFLNYVTAAVTSSKLPSVLSIWPEFSGSMVPATLDPIFPKFLLNLPKKAFADFSALLEYCNGIDVSCTSAQTEALENASRDQSKSTLWTRFRAGRCTASNMHRICRTQVDKPALSLITSIVYAPKFTSRATQYGCDHEDLARAEFMELFSREHIDSKIYVPGLWVRNHLAGTPDGIVTCQCHGQFVLEIKCPYCVRNKSLIEAAEEIRGFFLTVETEGVLALKSNHSYFYQVQTQLLVTELENAFFVVWTPKQMFMQQINIDHNCQKEITEKSLIFLKKCLLPEIISKWFTRQNNRESVRALTEQNLNCTEVEIRAVLSEDLSFLEIELPSSISLICDTPVRDSPVNSKKTASNFAK